MNLDPIATSSNLQTRNKAGFEPVSYKREYRVIRSTADTRDGLRYLEDGGGAGHDGQAGRRDASSPGN
jgi:hypothetical protein